MPSAEQMTPAGFGAFHKAEMDKWTPIIKAANIKPEGTWQRMLERTQRFFGSRGDLAPLIVRRIDAIPVALPLKAPMKMAGVTITKAENLIVRVEVAGRPGRLGRSASAPTMTGDTLGSLVAAVRDHLAPLSSARMRLRIIGRCCSVRSWATPARIRRSRWRCSMLPAAREQPVDRLAMKPPGAPTFAPMWLLGNATVDEDIAEAQTRLREGFNFFKLKIGVKPLATRSRPRMPSARRCPMRRFARTRTAG